MPLLASCGQRSSNGIPPTDASVDAPAADDGSVAGDGATADLLAPDAGPLLVSCAVDPPYLVVVQPASGDPVTLVRVPLSFSRAANGIKVDAVTQLNNAIAPVTLRTWDISTFSGPPGFAGSAVPMVGQKAAVRFTAKATSLAAESDACTSAPWKRPGGTLHVVGSTTEGGAFEVDCSYGLSLGGSSPERLRFACAKGVAGWLGGNGSESPGILATSVPAVALLANGGVHVQNLDAAATLSGLTATGALVTGHHPPAGLSCPTSTDPAPWPLSAGTHTLWTGGNSSQTWNGPVAPLEQADANWLFQQNGAAPAPGFCAASTSPPTCPPPVLQLVLTGSSSAGSYQWESDLFTCVN
jgi:hypothetical protein